LFIRLFNRQGLAVAATALALVTGAAIVASAQRAQSPTPMPLDPPRERGASVTPAFEGWYENPDGTFSLLIGYYNRNQRETLDIPVGPNNHVDPGPADQGQPTHFELGRQWGVFVVKVPKDFGTKAVTWTIVSGGETQAIPMSLSKAYPITPYKELGMGNQPPVFAFTQGGPKFTGPPTAVAATLSGSAGKPIPITVWVEDPKERGAEEAPAGRGPASIATVSFHVHRGAGAVTFDRARIPVPKQGDMITANATFAAAGDYTLRVQGNDESGEGGGGFQCCWTNTYVKVAVR
jgi:hypothetical protein